MSDPASRRLGLAKGAALACSLGLAGLVVVNAQFGCDAPAATAPADSKPVPDSEAKPPVAAPAPADPAAPVADPAAPVAEPADPATPTAVDETAGREGPDPASDTPVLMPASKSGGDFGAMRFPGQAAPTQQQQAPNNANNAPKHD